LLYSSFCGGGGFGGSGRKAANDCGYFRARALPAASFAPERSAASFFFCILFVLLAVLHAAITFSGSALRCAGSRVVRL